MRTFEQYVECKSLEPLVWKAANLMVELEIDPQDYLTMFVEDWSTGVNNAAAGMGQFTQGAGNMLQGASQMGGAALTGAVSGAWNKGAQAMNALGNSALGQGVRGWWQDFNSGDRKLEKAAALIQKAMSDPALQHSGEALSSMIHQLSFIAQNAKAHRKAAAPSPSPSPSPSPTPGPTP